MNHDGLQFLADNPLFCLSLLLNPTVGRFFLSSKHFQSSNWARKHTEQIAFELQEKITNSP